MHRDNEVRTLCMKDVNTIIREHNLILEVLDVMGKICDTMEGGRQMNKIYLSEITEFMDGFMDQYHHNKEERIIFPSLLGGSFNEDGMTVVKLVNQHAHGREMSKIMKHAISTMSNWSWNANRMFVTYARGYALFFTNHIFLENALIMNYMERGMVPTETKDESLKPVEEVSISDSYGELPKTLQKWLLD